MVKMGAREFVYPNFGYRSRWLRNRDPLYRGFSRDVTRSRACLVTPFIRHFGGQASAVACAVCALQCVVYASDQPVCGVVCLWML